MALVGALVVAVFVAVFVVKAPPAGAHLANVLTGYSPNLRSGPGTSYPRVGTLSGGQRIAIACTVTGETVQGPYGPTSVWDYVHLEAYVSDAYVYTGTSQPVGPPCGGAEFHYDRAELNLRVNQPGLVRLYQELLRTPQWNPGNAANRNLGIYADKPGMHAEGRALDYRMDADIPAERTAGWDLANHLKANAASYGVQEVIWDDRAWDARNPAADWVFYDAARQCGNTGKSCRHRDHLHIGMNWAGAVLMTRHWS
jgi:uncharacterized protein YraI